MEGTPSHGRRCPSVVAVQPVYSVHFNGLCAAALLPSAQTCSPDSVTKVPDDRAPQAIAYHWASRIMTVSMEMVLPGILGHLVDRWLGSKVVFTLIGFSVGMTAGMVHLLRMTRETSVDQADSESATQERSKR